MPTPWGMAQMKEQSVEGVWWVSTNNHGGIMVSKKRATELSEKARNMGKMWGYFYTFEEDCDFAVVLYEHPEWHPTWDTRPLDQIKETAKESLLRWNEAYFSTEW